MVSGEEGTKIEKGKWVRSYDFRIGGVVSSFDLYNSMAIINY